jgi:hypothetical protein
MVDITNIREKITTVRVVEFQSFKKAAREISLEKPDNLSFEEISGEETAVFCRFAEKIVTLFYVYNKEQFNYYKIIGDILLIFPRELETIPFTQPEIRPKIVRQSKTRKRGYCGSPYWWKKALCA